MEKTLILVVGNTLMSDDGIGPEAVTILLKKYNFPKYIKIIDGGTQGLELFHYFEGIKNLAIIDAISSVDHKPGEVVKISKGKIARYFTTKISSHDIGLHDIISSLDLLNKVPENMIIIGMVPNELYFSYGLSDVVKNNIGKLIAEILEQLRVWGINNMSYIDACLGL